MQMMKFRQMPLLLLPMSQYMGEIVEIFVFDHTYDTILVRSMVNEGFMMKMMKFRKMPVLFTANEPKVRGNNGNFPNCNTDKCIAVPNEGNR